MDSLTLLRDANQKWVSRTTAHIDAPIVNSRPNFVYFIAFIIPTSLRFSPTPYLEAIELLLEGVLCSSPKYSGFKKCEIPEKWFTESTNAPFWMRIRITEFSRIADVFMIHGIGKPPLAREPARRELYYQLLYFRTNKHLTIARLEIWHRALQNPINGSFLFRNEFRFASRKQKQN